MCLFYLDRSPTLGFRAGRWRLGSAGEEEAVEAAGCGLHQSVLPSQPDNDQGD